MRNLDMCMERGWFNILYMCYSKLISLYTLLVVVTVPFKGGQTEQKQCHLTGSWVRVS